MKIQLNKILKNPHRNMARNPITESQVESLLESFERNGVWANVVVRKAGNNYELAYGHNRLEAMKRLGLKEGDFIVEELSDWAMYTAMVDENESQQSVTPTLIYENIESGIAYIEPLVRQSETVEELSKLVATAVGTDKSAYAGVRNNLLNGQGLGARFLDSVLVGSKTATWHNIQMVIDSHYGNLKEQAKQVKADAKLEEAKARRQEADAEKSTAKALKLKEEAEKLEQQAENLEVEAKKLASTATEETLLMFSNAYQMKEFAAGVKRHKVPREHHMALVAYLLNGNVGSGNYAREIDTWWFRASGAFSKQAEANARESFKRKHKSITLEEHIQALAPKMREVIKMIDAAAPYVLQISDQKAMGKVESAMAEMQHAIDNWKQNQKEELQNVTPDLKLIEG